MRVNLKVGSFGALSVWSTYDPKEESQILPKGVDRSRLWSSESQGEAVEMEKIDLWAD